MAERELDKLNDLQFDVLKEIGNIGAGNATTALAKMLNTKIDMNVPRVEMVPFTQLPDTFGSPEEASQNNFALSVSMARFGIELIAKRTDTFLKTTSGPALAR